MNFVSIILGCAAIGYGLLTAYLRAANPAIFRKLEPMKKVWGETGGVVVHVIGYTAVPIVVGIALIVYGLQGGGEN